MEELNFATPAEEIEYWKSKAVAFEQQAKDVKEELEEYQEGSKELEAELEAQLDQAEKNSREYKSLANRLQVENDSLKDKLEQCHKEYHYQISELQTELAEIKSIRDHLNKYIRELEQQNDDLERGKRETTASLEDFEARMNSAMERNVFLESELDEKESLKAALQRMKDESRDLRAELQILAGKQRTYSRETSFDTVAERSMSANVTANGDLPDNDRSLLMSKRRGNSVEIETNNNMLKRRGSPDSNKLAEDVESRESWLETPPSSTKSSPLSTGGGAASKYGPSQPLTPSARTSALNIVSDLLRKVGALELKLSSCRNIVKLDHHHQTRSSPGTPTSSVLSTAASLNGVHNETDRRGSTADRLNDISTTPEATTVRKFSRGDSSSKKIFEH